ncbi:hypothetical protein TSUD_297110 [Trifolium subterraneum]|uniref:Putative plant transposon protein domain-containing protein n=1 Tax=Trifolium subterraneum TaxID=3900 RepID=A0A2Z6NAZ3_TRISU|nr:hypothetical protein TSUD_297110 [Trifolium subterraneum]
MVLKKNLSSKKPKTDAGSSREVEFWAEKVFDILPTGMYRDFAEVIHERWWNKLPNPPQTINDDLVREFYANAVPTNEDAPFSFTTMICGHPLRFDREAINAYLGNPHTLVNEDGLCPYARILAQGNWNVDHMKQKLLLPDRNIKFNTAGLPLRALRGDMKPKAQLTLLFILHNIPCSHLSDAPMNILGLLYCVHAGKDVDVARVIANELKVIASSGVTDHSRPKFPSIDPMLQNWFHQTWDQNAANHRADIAMYEAVYRMNLQQPLDEPNMFQTHNAWPGDKPNFVGGAGVEAGADGDGAGVDDDAIDEAAANAFDDNDASGEDEQYEEMSD